jgi:hypothetical protein
LMAVMIALMSKLMKKAIQSEKTSGMYLAGSLLMAACSETKIAGWISLIHPANCVS